MKFPSITRGFASVILASLLFSLSFTQMANAAVTATKVTAQSTATSANGSMYNGNMWLKSNNLIKKLTNAGTLTTEYTIPSTIGGVSTGSFVTSSVDIDPATGVMYFATGSMPMKIWSIDIDNLSSGATLLFSGLNACNAYTGGIVKVGTYLYFSCPDSYTLENSKLYRFTIPSSGGAALSDSGLTTIAASSTVQGFVDLEYRSQDGVIFALMKNGSSYRTNSIAKINPSGSLPASVTTFITFTGSYGGITGIELDTQGNIFYSIYAGATNDIGVYQVTSETPTVTSSGTYNLPSGSADYIYSTGLMLDQGSLSTSSTIIGYSVSGWGALTKFEGAAISTKVTVDDLIVIISTTTLTIPNGPFIYRQSYTFTAVTNAAGKVSFWVNGKAAAGCKGRIVNAGNSFTFACSYKPSLRGSLSVYTTFVPSGNATASTSATKYFSVVGRAGNR